MIWLLAILWLFLNFFDIFVSWMGIQLGATEVGLVYQLSGDFGMGSVIKIVVAVLVATYTVWRRKVKLLIFANGIVLAAIIWNIFRLRQL